MGRCHQSIWRVFGDLTPAFTVTAAPGERDEQQRCGGGGGEERGEEGAFFVVSNTPYVYLRELYEFCKEFEVHAAVNLTPDDNIDNIVFQEAPTSDPVPNYHLIDLNIDKLIQDVDGNSREMKGTLMGILAHLGYQRGEITLKRRTFESYLVVPVSKVTTSQLHAIFALPDVVQATIYPGMWTGISVRIRGSPAAPPGQVQMLPHQPQQQQQQQASMYPPVQMATPTPSQPHVLRAGEESGKAKVAVRRETVSRFDPYARKGPGKIECVTTFKESKVQVVRPSTLAN